MYDRSDQVRVRNGTNSVIRGRWDGKDFVWQPGQHLDVPLVVAAHVFGFGGDEKAQLDAFTRLGWTNSTTDIEAARERYALVSFSDCPALIEVDDRIGNVRPLVNAGGDSGGRLTPPPDEPPAEEGDSL